MRTIGLALLLLAGCIFGALGFGGFAGEAAIMLQVLCAVAMSTFFAEVAQDLRRVW